MNVSRTSTRDPSAARFASAASRDRRIPPASGLTAAALTVLACLVLAGCDLGSPQSQLQNVLLSAPVLPEFNRNNEYTPYYQTGELNTPRYLHQAVTHTNGFVYVFGGSDERGLSSLASVEFFDQSTFDQNLPPVESKTGLWLDTDIEGNPLTLVNGPRLLHTVTELGNNDLIIAGGAVDLGLGPIHDQAEIFDPAERTFELVEGEMVLARFNHQAFFLSDGNLLISGGQFHTTVTIIDETLPPGQQQRQETRFPSTFTCEIYSTTTGGFERLRLADDSGRESRLQTRRGRADHAITTLAGPDNRLGSGDDMIIVAAGIQTLSAVSGLAPRFKFPLTPEFDGLTSFEIFDPATRAFTLIASVKLEAARIDHPAIVNLGEFNNRTPDGVLGMGNAVLATHGNTGDPVCPVTPLLDQVFVALYSPGAGPAQGIHFFESREDQFFSRIQHIEYIDPSGLILRGVQVGRCATNPVSLPHPVEVLDASGNIVGTTTASWVFSLAGVDIFIIPPCVVNHSSEAMLAGCVFDPFYNLAVAINNNASPRNLRIERQAHPENFLGIVGAWFTIDSDIDGTINSWGQTPPDRWPENKGFERVYTICTPLGGPDGRLGSFDDRILLTGGGRDYRFLGGEPSSPSAEIFLPPGSSRFADN